MATQPSSLDMAEVLHLYRIDDLVGAEARCRAIVARDPRCGEAWDRLARIAERQGRIDEAIAHYGRAVDTLERPAEAHANLAMLLQRRADLDGALTHYQRAVALGLDHAMLHSNLGALLRQRGRLRESADELTRALAIDPTLAHAHSNLGVTLALLGLHDGMARALPHLRRAVALQPDWDVAHSNLLLCLNYCDDWAPDEIAAAHFAFGRRHAAARATLDAPLPTPRSSPRSSPDDSIDGERPLRVGLVSPDFKRHSVAHFVEPILTARDADALSITCYADVERPDGITERMRAAADRWRTIHGLPDSEVARLVRADRIDILIDLAGHTAGNRLSLFATRVAPLQVTYLGYPNTTGLDTVDWRITDAWADPPGASEGLHSEELLRVAGGFLCFRPHPDSPDPTPSPSRTRGRVTFASFNQAAKISATTLAMWSAILRQVPGARLALKGPTFGDATTRAAFQQRLAGSPLAGLDVELWTPEPDERDHLAAYGGVDIALDTFPYGGTTTTCEALWMGVPVVTLAGHSHAARVGASLLTRLGEPALIADSPSAYVSTAVALAHDEERRAGLRASLRGLMTASGITDGRSFARAFGEALRHAWRLHCRRARAADRALPPASATAPLTGDLRVVVPDRLDQITPYVLTEQHDWFEDEIGFVRTALTRGERAIDIGANHGVYALSMARRVGYAGQVWAFEPARAVAERLRASVEINALPQLAVVDAALGDREGEGELSAGGQSELGRVESLAPGSGGARDGAAGGVASGPGETVALYTLDGCRQRLGLADIAFVKIDAEGAEAAIIDGGRGFFADESPLVMFEVRHGAALDFGLIERFGRLGYQAFRLIPGLGILAPFVLPAPAHAANAASAGADQPGAVDPFLLNLFACKAERAQRLERLGLLSRGGPADQGEPPAEGDGLAFLRAQLFAAALWPRWTRAGGDALAADARAALDGFARARDVTRSPAVRHAALDRALAAARSWLRAQPAPALPALQTLARLAAESGERAAAVQACNQIVGLCATALDVDLDHLFDEPFAHPFLAISARFDHIPAREGPGELARWVLAAALEQRERLRAFSSFFTPADADARAALETIGRLGYESPEMARRRELLQLPR